MATIILRGSKLSPLTNAEVDANFNNINVEVLSIINTMLPLKAPLASPALTGTPTAPTAALNTNTTQLATTAFVIGQAGTASPIQVGVSAAGTSTKFAREDHSHPTNATSTNTASTIVARDASGNFSAGTITAALSGNATTANALTTARTISLEGDVTGSVSFDGSANASITATVVDDSHNHVIANVDGLSTELNLRVSKDSNTGSAALPAGTTAQRTASPATGALRFNSTLTQFEGYNGTAWGTFGADDASAIDFQQAGTGAVTRTMQDKGRETVSVLDFGADPTGTADSATAIQAAADYAATHHKELFFPDGTYKVLTKISIDGAATAFRAVRWRGTFCGTGTSAGYAPDLGRPGTVIQTAGNAALEVWFRRFFNENVSIRGIAFVDTASVYPGAITAAAAIKLIKGDPAGYPAEKRYISNHVFEDVAVCGYADAVVFRGSYRKDEGGAYTDNYFGPISFVRFYPYQCGTGIVAENATLNRLRVTESLFFSLSGGGIVKREAVDLPLAARTEMIIMCQLDMVHFEDVRGLFRLSGAPPAGEFNNYLSMCDVTRELCGLFDAQNGNPYGQVEHTNIILNGRHDQWGELTRPALGISSSITSQTAQNIHVLAGPGVSNSPDRINILYDVNSLVSGGASLIKSLIVAEGAGIEADITSRVIIKGGELGIKTFHSYGKTQAGTGGRFHDSEGQLAAGLTATVNTASGNAIQEFVVQNTTGATVTVVLEVINNRTGCQLYLA